MSEREAIYDLATEFYRKGLKEGIEISADTLSSVLSESIVEAAELLKKELIKNVDNVSIEIDEERQKRFDALEKKRVEDWIPVEERKPSIDCPVLVCWNSYERNQWEEAIYSARYRGDDHWTASNVTINTPKYWMPRPKHPGGER